MSAPHLRAGWVASPFLGNGVKTFTPTLVGKPRPIYVWETPYDNDTFLQFIVDHGGRPIAVDSETSGLDPYAPTFELRLVQFGTKEAAWVIPFTEGTAHLIRRGLSWARKLVIHNASFDLKVFEAMGLLDLDTGWYKTADTRLMAHLLDPRGIHEGGTGHKLENLSDAYFGESSDEHQKGLFDHFRANKWKRDDGYRLVDIAEPLYLVYSGVDVILTSWLYEALQPLVATRFQHLHAFEHEVGRICSNFERRGMLVDAEYGAELTAHYAEMEAEAKHTAATFGITKLGSPTQVPSVLEALGADLVEKTPTGRPKVDKRVLEALVANNEGEPLGEVANAILVGKNASKWSKAYVQNTLDRLDGHGRVHPSIKSLEARTARMSVSEPPLQQLPSGDWRVRRLFIAEPGHSYFSVDYSQVELRILAALSKEPTMLAAINGGQDLHDVTAELLYGADFTKDQRKLAKNTNFGEVFGGGAATLARQAGVSLDEAKAAKNLYKRSYPAITRFSRNLRERADFGKRAVVTPSGRELPLDRDRLYSATNYVVQSTARDVLCQALIDLDAAGLTDYIHLPIHDEVLGQAPEVEAEEIVREIERVMTMPFMDLVTLDAEGEVMGDNWGRAYGGPSRWTDV